MNASVLLIILLSLVGLAAIAVAAVSVRRRAIGRLKGAFDCSYSVGVDSSHRPRWRLGVAVFSVSTLDWYPIFGFSSRPAVRLPRSTMEIAERTKPEGDERFAVMSDAYIATLTINSGNPDPRICRLALDADSLSALSAWIESSPPGDNIAVGRFN